MQGVQAWLAFSESAKRGGFAAAARELGCAPSTLAKAVARLEASLGLRLFHRTTRKLSLTADGERLFERCQRVLAELEELQTEAAGARAEPTGLLRIDMPVVYGRKRILPLLARLLQRHPGLRLDARFSDGHVDLVRDGIDLAIRTGELADSRLVARRIDAQALLLVGRRPICARAACRAGSRTWPRSAAWCSACRPAGATGPCSSASTASWWSCGPSMGCASTTARRWCRPRCWAWVWPRCRR